jgi:hypothetical protein
MRDPTIPLDHDALSGLLNDLVMIRLVTVVNLASLSILELLEYGLSRKDISRAMAKGLIEFDTQPPTLATLETMNKGEGVVGHVLETGDYYFGLLSSKVKLTKLGLYMLEIIETDTATATVEEHGLQRLQNENEDLFNRPAPPYI